MAKGKGTLIFDVETHAAEYLYSMPPEEFVRLCGYKWKGEDEVHITTDLEELRVAILSARFIVGHNIHAFDLRAVFGIDSNIPMQLADEERTFDTWVHAVLVHPAPREYINRHGKRVKAEKPEQMKSWFGLDEQAYQLGVAGKTHDLKELAMEFGDPELTGKEFLRSGFGRIPVDDPRFVEYLKGDVLASEAVARALLEKGPFNAYAKREQRIASRIACISSNGFRVDIEKAKARVEELRARREAILRELEDKYGLPTEGDAPWATNEGKSAILAALADHGITPNTVDWPKTPAWENRHTKKKEALEKANKLEENVRFWRSELESSELPPRSVAARERWIKAAESEIEMIRKNPLPNHFGLSMSGETLKEITKGTSAEDLGQALAELKGQRSLAQLALDCVHPDGMVHPEITMLQRSGRASTTEPGLTVWTARGPGAVEKSYFIPDNPDQVLLEIDYSNADARIVAALSGDKKYAERFEPGADGHLINAWAAWGKDVVGTDLNDPKTQAYRQKAKVPGHGWGYRIGAKTLAKQTGMSEQEAKQFLDNMNKAFPDVVKWQDKEYKFGERHGFVINDWGRKMWIEEGRAFTQAPALQGQSGTREIACDFLLSLPYKAMRTVKAFVHDAFVFSVPKDRFEECRDYLVKKMTTSFKPKKGGQRIEFPVSAGPAADNWMDAGH